MFKVNDNMENIINLYEKFNSNLTMRYAAETLFKDINENEKVIVDFYNITFMGKSFAQEYVYQKQQLPVEVVEINKSDFVKRMFNAVKLSFNL